MNRPSQDALGAEATLVALRAGLTNPGDVDTDILVLAPEGERISRGRIIEVLASLRKPVECRATTDGTTFVLHHRSLSTAKELRDWDEWIKTSVAADVVRLRQEFGASVVNPYFLLRGHNESLLLDGDTLAKWTRDYDLVDVTRILDVADAEAIALGASGVVSFGPPARIASWTRSG